MTSETASPGPEPRSTGPGPRTRSSGRSVIAIGAFGAIALGILSYSLPAMFIKHTFDRRPARLDKFFDVVEHALRAYAVDHGAFPPEEAMALHWKSEKLREKTRALDVTTYRVSALTTPVDYLEREKECDPFALPEQFAPAAYAICRGFAVIWSPGQNLRYDIKPWELHDLARADAERVLRLRTYDPTNGTRSGGDLWRIVEPPAK